MSAAKTDNLAEYREKLHALLCSKTKPIPRRSYTPPEPVNPKNVQFEALPNNHKIAELEQTINQKNEKILKLGKIISTKDEQIKKLIEKIKYIELAQENKDLKIKQLEHLIYDLRQTLNNVREENIEALSNSFIEDSFVDEPNTKLPQSIENTLDIELPTEKLMNLDLKDLSFENDNLSKSKEYNEYNHINILNFNSIDDSEDNSDLENYLFDI